MVQMRGVVQPQGERGDPLPAAPHARKALNMGSRAGSVRRTLVIALALTDVQGAGTPVGDHVREVVLERALGRGERGQRLRLRLRLAAGRCRNPLRSASR